MSALKQNLAITTTPSHELHLRAVPTPTPGPNECLIHVRATGICGSDVHFWKEGGIGSSKVEGELGLGHESAGVVVGLGEGVENWRVGECFSFSFVLILVMAVVSGGDAIFGELPFTVLGFLIFFVIFWLMIAWIF